MEKLADISWPPDDMAPPEWLAEYEAYCDAVERERHELTQSVDNPWEQGAHDA